ncbi:MAG: pyrimidine/purine nucleoside phosphorylase [Sulfurospirillaceae bacterium]|nr:pyrimidine/purine nucleoside phosphorylase [Sulfurospirillaceae bacterium]
MDRFTNVSIIKKANVYFDGKVTSRTVLFEDGERKTLGIMMPGNYEFGTEQAEIIEILAGDLEILLPDESSWKSVAEGDEFQVKANSKFSLRVKTITDYCCSYIND